MIELDYTLLSVVIHKRSLRFTDNFQKKYFLYFYATRLLLEAATAWVHENQPGPLRVEFSTRRGLSVDSFCEYLEIVRTSRHVTRDYVKWQYIDHRHFHASPNRNLVGLQMADCYASAIGQALELNDHDMTDCCYVRQLQPKIMARNGTCKGYGVKIWPPPGRAIMTQPRLDWYHLI